LESDNYIAVITNNLGDELIGLDYEIGNPEIAYCNSVFGVIDMTNCSECDIRMYSKAGGDEWICPNCGKTVSLGVFV